MYIKQIQLDNHIINLSDNLNVITGKDVEIFYYFAYVISFFDYFNETVHWNANLIFDLNLPFVYSYIKVVYILDDGKEYDIVIKYHIYSDHDYYIENIDELRQKINELKKINSNKSLILFTTEMNNMHDCEIYTNNSNQIVNSFTNYTFSKEVIFLAKCFVNFTYNNIDKVHYNNLKQIINELLAVNNNENFSYSVSHSRFTYWNNGTQKVLRNSPDCLMKIIFLAVSIYKHQLEFIRKTNSDYIGNCMDANGIIVCDYRFAERPSYSDKKWEYFNILHKYFPKVQFICE